VFNALGVPKTFEEVQAIVKEVDDDGSGEIEFSEFCVIMEGDKKPMTEEEMKEEFTKCTNMTMPNESSGKSEVITINNMRAIADLLGEDKTDAELQVR
jgi:Ca2+-binding EF-hand superfamily protein